MSGSKIKLAFFDIDGTLVSFKTHEMPQSTLRALDELRQNGVRVALATGRGTYCIRPEVLEQFDIRVTLNGQYCYDADGVYRSLPLNDADNKVIADRVFAGEYHALAMFGDMQFVDEATPRVRETAELVGIDFQPGDFTRVYREPVYQYNLYIDREDEAQALRGCTDVAVTRWTDLFCDVVPAAGGKSYGIAATLERYGLDASEAIAFGDGENDISMLKAVGTSVAMGNAWDIVKEAATYVTDDVDHDGIYNACKHFGLI